MIKDLSKGLISFLKRKGFAGGFLNSECALWKDDLFKNRLFDCVLFCFVWIRQHFFGPDLLIIVQHGEGAYADGLFSFLSFYEESTFPSSVR